jgi:molybdenum cofactor guanylyltransferase
VTALVVGVFVGGRGTRMGGVAKGLLKAPGSEQTLLERLSSEVTRALPRAPIVLVGAADAYGALGLLALPDEPAGIGPLGGLSSLLQHAERLAAGQVLAVACDLPRLSASLVARLASEAPGAAALVPDLSGVRNPLIARYDVARTLPALGDVLRSGKRSLQAVLDRLGNDVRTLPLSVDEAASLLDWDTPEDVR